MDDTIRFLTEDNLTEVSKTFTKVFNSEPWNELWSYETSYKRLNDIIKTPGYMGIGYFNASNEIIGFLVGNEEQWAESRSFYINEICVLKDTQQKGVGTSLLKYFRIILAERKISTAYLSTERGIGMPELFFEKNGFITNESRIIMNLTIL